MPGPAPHLQYGFDEQQVTGQFPLQIVGGNHFGRYSKISAEQTFNFIVSDGFLVPYAGYKRAVEIGGSSIGRGLYASTIGNIMIAVVGTVTYTIDSNLVAQPIPGGQLLTNSGDVYIAENNNKEICITDGAYVYVWNYGTNTFSASYPGAINPIVFNYTNPGYVAFQNGRLIIACLNTQTWVLSAFNNAISWPNDEQHVGTLQSKPCTIQAAFPVPGGGNNLLLFGTNVAESWQDLGLALFPYQRNNTFNIDYGCLNAASIASLENYVVWLSYNEQSGPAVSYTNGGPIKNISTDGIDFKLADLKNPTNCTGFLFRQDGHLLYQFCFPDDNLSYAYDFESELFFTVTDENLNHHIARQVVFFNNQYYFVSLNAGNVYTFGTQFTNADYGDGNIRPLARIRVCPPLRLPDQRYYIAKSLGFTIENGQPNMEETVSNITTFSESVDLSVSRDGGETFGASWRLDMNPTGQRKSRFIYQRLGIANDATFQLRFNGFGRFVCTQGIVEVYQ